MLTTFVQTYQYYGPWDVDEFFKGQADNKKHGMAIAGWFRDEVVVPFATTNGNDYGRSVGALKDKSIQASGDPWLLSVLRDICKD